MIRPSSIVIGFAVCALVGCIADVAETGESQTQNSVSSVSSSQPVGAPSDFENIEDPVEKCFTVDVPKGWHNRAYTARAYDIHREVVTSVSPDSQTVIFLGDPKIPQYWAPNSGNPFVEEFCDVNPMMELASYQSAEIYFPDYAKRKFGKLDDFEIISVNPNDEMLSKLRQAFAKHGFDAAEAAAIDLTFTYTDKGKSVNGLLMGYTVNSGGFWLVDVWGLSTTGDIETFRPTLMHIANSKKTNPEWTALQNQKHEERMAQMRAHQQMMNARHEQNMQWIQQSAARHQNRMQAIWAANDASMQSYWDRSASSDLQHQRFLNYINEENTVVGSSGEVRQVDNSYQRYYINKNNNTYVGGDINFDDRSIRKLGLNPDDYEEAKIRP